MDKYLLCMIFPQNISIFWSYLLENIYNIACRRSSYWNSHSNIFQKCCLDIEERSEN